MARAVCGSPDWFQAFRNDIRASTRACHIRTIMDTMPGRRTSARRACPNIYNDQYAPGLRLWRQGISALLPL